MKEVDGYDHDGGEYEIISAVNYWNCDTCRVPDSAEFV